MTTTLRKARIVWFVFVFCPNPSVSSAVRELRVPNDWINKNGFDVFIETVIKIYYV